MEDNAIRLQQHGISAVNAYCHANCTQPLTNILQAVWENSDTVLADVI